MTKKRERNDVLDISHGHAIEPKNIFTGAPSPVIYMYGMSNVQKLK